MSLRFITPGGSPCDLKYQYITFLMHYHIKALGLYVFKRLFAGLVCPGKVAAVRLKTNTNCCCHNGNNNNYWTFELVCCRKVQLQQKGKAKKRIKSNKKLKSLKMYWQVTFLTKNSKFWILHMPPRKNVI